MRRAFTVTRRIISAYLCASLLLPLCVTAQDGQDNQSQPGGAAKTARSGRRTEQRHRRVIVVNAEQPNVWTLEQAHYLLAQMHRRNLDLKASGLGELDPNEINGLNFDILRTLLEVGVTYDDAARFNNSLLKRDKRYGADRAINLQTRRDRLAEESLSLNRDIARLGRDRALATSQEEKDALGAQITEMTAVRDANNAEVTRLDNDLKTETGPTGELQATEAQAAFDPNKLPKSTFDDAFKNVTKELMDRFNQAPKLNATLRLDNYLQMQYEIIAKQLTLLRDEVGPGQRIIFLELPQTVNASHGKANNKWAQSWWSVVGYTTPVAFPVLSIRDANGNGRVGEGNAGTARASFLVTLSPASTHRVTVKYRTENGTATAGSDYTTEDGILTFAPGETTKTISVQVNGDVEAEKNERFSVVLSDATNEGRTVVFGDTRARATILNDDKGSGSQPDPDVQALLNLGQPQYQTYTVQEGGQTLRITGQIKDRGTANTDTIVQSAEVEEEDDDDSGRPRSPGYEQVGSRRTTTQIVDDAIQAFKNNGSTERVVLHRLAQDAEAAGGVIMPENPSVRAIELIPRQGSLNVNDLKLRARSGVLTAVAKTLFGVGARLNYQRQRETFSQFVQQELYSSAFGKGSREFGWTFTPMPGTDRVLSGVRTTYAVMVVPQEAETLLLNTTGCYFPRSEYQPNNFANTDDSRWVDDDRQFRNCSERRAFVVPIPGGGATESSDFWVESLEYIPARKGERVVLSINGRNFSSQTGVLVDGVPLTQALGLAQPFIRDDSVTGEKTVKDLEGINIRGRIERVDSNQIMAVFERLDGKEGTPVITLTSPGKAKNLNRLKLRVNENYGTTLADSPYMFGKKADEKDKFRIEKVEVFRSRPPADPSSVGTLTAMIRGAGFQVAGKQTLQKVLVNGTELDLRDEKKSDLSSQGTSIYTVISPTLMRAEFPIPPDDTIRFALILDPNDEKKSDKDQKKPAAGPVTIESEPVANPARLRVGEVSVVSYEAATDEEDATLVVRIEGSGFSDDLVAYVEDELYPVVVKSSTEALLKITNPKAAVMVILKDRQTGLQTKTIVTRKTEPPK